MFIMFRHFSVSLLFTKARKFTSLIERHNYFSVFIVIVNLVNFVNTMALNNIEIPGAVQNGSKIWLHCDFEILTNATFSVKWYRNDIEFFRIEFTKFIVFDKRFFAQRGINVNITKSNYTHIYLEDVDIETEGTYSCEVSNSEFISAKLSSDLRVYVLSNEKLQLIGVKPSYLIGDLVDICCMSGYTKPPTILAWFVNGNRIWQSEPNLNLTWTVRYRDSDGLSVSMINITFNISKDNDLMNGPLHLKCSSIISQIFGNSYEELIIQRNLLASNDRVKYPMRVNSRKNKLIPPQINGISSRYKVGDQLLVNCTASDTYPPSALKWIINNKEATEKQLLRYNTNPFNSLHKAANFTASIYDHFAVFEKRKSSVLGLTFKVTEKHYQGMDGTMKLQCYATYAKIMQTETIGLTLFSDGRTSSYLHSNEVNCSKELTKAGNAIMSCLLLLLLWWLRFVAVFVGYM